MKAWIGAILLSAAGTGMADIAHGQSPAFQRTLPLTPTVPPPLMPDMPAISTNRAGAQLPQPMIALPAPPIVQKAGEPQPTFSPVDLNAAYQDPFLPPDQEITSYIEDMPQASSGPRLWITADYLMWWTKRGPQPDPLVVTGPETDPFPGALDQPGTRVLYGGQGFDYNPFSGFRTSVGFWCGGDNRLGFEFNGFILEQKSTQFRAGGNAQGQPFLARPFNNAQTGNENVFFTSQNFADPTRSAFMRGSIDVTSNSKMWNWELNTLFTGYRDERMAVSLIGGFRSVVLRERLAISEELQNLLPDTGGVVFRGIPVDPTQRVLTFDKFNAENAFFGGQLGTRIHLQAGRWAIDMTGKAAIGTMQQLVNVEGLTAIDGPNNRVGLTAPGGVYALPSNMGRHYRERLGFVPEGNVDLSYTLSQNLIVKAGYSFLWINSVARPGNQIDRTVDPAQVPSDASFGQPGGPPRPFFPFYTESFWAQGLNLSLEVRY